MGVTETGSFSAVVCKHRVSQASVTRQIELLARHFGVCPLHRTTCLLNLTGVGATLVSHARTVLDAVEPMEEALGCQSGERLCPRKLSSMIHLSRCSGHRRSVHDCVPPSDITRLSST
jgi:DNA-binding transcriptional LysR family regulator